VWGIWSLVLLVLLLVISCEEPLYKVDAPNQAGVSLQVRQVAVDQRAHRLYASNTTMKAVDIYDISEAAAKFEKSIPLGVEPFGIVLAPDLGKLFTGNSDSTLAIIDVAPTSSRTDRLLAKVPTGGKTRADLLTYDIRERKVYLANPDEGFVTSVDAIRNQALQRIDLAKGLRQPRYDPADGMVYITDADSNLLFQVDPHRDALVQKWTVPGTCLPAGFAIDSKRQRALIGCTTPGMQLTLLWDLAHRLLLMRFPQVGQAEQVIYDPAVDRYLAAGSSGGSSALAVFTGDPVTFAGSVQTQADSRAVGYDEAHGRFYVPTAKPGEGGLIGGPLPTGEAQYPVSWVLIMLSVPLVLLGVIVFFYGRRRTREGAAGGSPLVT